MYVPPLPSSFEVHLAPRATTELGELPGREVDAIKAELRRIARLAADAPVASSAPRIPDILPGVTRLRSVILEYRIDLELRRISLEGVTRLDGERPLRAVPAATLDASQRT